MHSNKLEILEMSYWEHFAAAKNLAMYLPASHSKRIRVEGALEDIRKEMQEEKDKQKEEQQKEEQKAND